MFTEQNCQTPDEYVKTAETEPKNPKVTLDPKMPATVLGNVLLATGTTGNETRFHPCTNVNGQLYTDGTDVV